MFGTTSLSTIKQTVAEAKQRDPIGFARLESAIQELRGTLSKVFKMEIEFSKRSRFLDQCMAEVRLQRTRLQRGESIDIALGAGGYDGEVVVNIIAKNKQRFETDWESSDESRFPVRIKAGATALSNSGCYGRFKLEHKDGVLSIHPVSVEPASCSVGTTIFLVSCVKTKRKRACPARDLYSSGWFQKARAYVEASGLPWFILSAEYGLVAPLDEIAPYEKTLNKMPVAERREWAARVLRQLEKTVPDLARVVFLAGVSYREFLTSALARKNVEVLVPMGRLRQGLQNRWLKTNTPETLFI